MQGRPTNGSFSDSPALRFTADGDDNQEGVSLWEGDGDELSLDMLTDVDEELDEDVR